ncbi:MAG: aconitate hydratase [Gammaproteobacteria bacterium]|nr:aconitate hydratase [Gammaproteobacteria bacterium]
MALNVARKLIETHLVDGDMTPGAEIALRIDQTLTQDATGTLAMLEFEALGVPRVRTELSAQYVDHNLLQADERNADDHLFLHSACRKFGVWYSRPGNGVSHPLHMERFGIPGKTLLGADSHTCAAGSLGMLAIGAGGLEVATAMAGEPFHMRMPEIFGIRLRGELPEWVSAKDVILELLRRHGVAGGVGRIIEYHGPGLASLDAMDRHVIANMGAELGATTSVFPADEAVREFLRQQERGEDWREIEPDAGAGYDLQDEIDLADVEPLIACPGSPGNVVPVGEVAGRTLYQAYLGSSANPGLRDLAVPALMVRDRQVHPQVSFDVNPTSRQMLECLLETGHLGRLLRAGARLHQAGCNGCIGMGQAPATDRASLRTVPRNFPGRSGTREDAVYLCSPETATASALTGRITDPRTLDMDYPRFRHPDSVRVERDMFVSPLDEPGEIALVKGPNIRALPEFEALPDRIAGPVLLKLGDDVSTDEIMVAGSRVLPLRSNIPAISRFVFANVDESYAERARARRSQGSLIVAGHNYGQGSSREHAALAPRFLGLRAVLAKSFARIHRQNLINFGVLPMIFDEPEDHDSISTEHEVELDSVRSALQRGEASIRALNKTTGRTIHLRHELSDRQRAIVCAGGLINHLREQAS